MMKYKYHYQIEWDCLGLCHNDEVQISLSDWMDGLGLCHNDEVQISLSDWRDGLGLCHNDEIQISLSDWIGWFRSLP